jgi:hypothetical protein
MNNSKFLEIAEAWTAQSEGTHVALILKTKEGPVGYLLDRGKIQELRKALNDAEAFLTFRDA